MDTGRHLAVTVGLKIREINMRKPKLYIYFVIAGLVILLGLAIALLYKNPPYLYYAQFTSPHELPTRLIRTTFYRLARHELPQKADGLRAIFTGGRDQTIFVIFRTDSEGLAYILEKFSGPGVQSITYNRDLEYPPASGWAILPELSRAQKALGICIFDQDSFKSGRLLFEPGNPRGQPGYRIFINDQTRTVCMSVWAY